MFHRKRFRMAIVVILTLLLTVALAPVAAAQDVGIGGGPPPASTGDNGDDTGTDDTVTPLPGNGNGANGTTPLPGNGNGNGNNGTDTPAGQWQRGNGDTPAGQWQWQRRHDGNADKRQHDDGAAGVLAAAQCDCVSCRYANPDKRARRWAALLLHRPRTAPHTNWRRYSVRSARWRRCIPAAAAVSLYSGSNPGSGKPVTIEYLPADMKIRVSTLLRGQAAA